VEYWIAGLIGIALGIPIAVLIGLVVGLVIVRDRRKTIDPWSSQGLLCPDCGHHIHRPRPCSWTFGAGKNERPCTCPAHTLAAHKVEAQP